ncbi:hypothetical protein EYF80_009700 [Liparis tanakae]|uniref:Uncharacterized protein n=1 Tax=Liparis tanakae TaxID=230148 RepID=A0A4Z2IQ07_9TELE|nr:hypothetical protein EYF80_009700 [Liparis tanakae]
MFTGSLWPSNGSKPQSREKTAQSPRCPSGRTSLAQKVFFGLGFVWGGSSHTPRTLPLDILNMSRNLHILGYMMGYKIDENS